MKQISREKWALYAIAAVIGAAIFIVMEVVPLVQSVSKHEYGYKVIEKSLAEEHAAAFAEEMTGFAASSIRVVHQTDKLFTGYLSREELLESYEQEYGSRFPTDTFQANVDFDGRNGRAFIYMDMFTGDIVAWRFAVPGEALEEEKQDELIRPLLQSRGFGDSDAARLRGNEWKAEGIRAGEAELHIETRASLVNGREMVTVYKPYFQVPEAYKTYVSKQDRIAGWLTGVGYLLMSIVLGILAIIYAILYRKHTSFKYGILLTAVFLVAYIIMNLNVMDGVVAASGEAPIGGGVLAITAVVTVMLAIAMAGSVYVSIVAGDGLWKAQGRNLWPRLGMPGYGDYVWRSMGLSYLFAIIMLGLQPILFLLLKLTIGTWSTSDVTMSPYNVGILWLMPVLAWAAAISEEAVFRFFGIGLFRKWFRHTFAAAILPTLFWSLGHVMYPFYPSTTRLFELMIIGLLFSFIFVRYGFITAMFTHAIFNSIAVASSLYMVGSAPNVVSATFFILLPVLIAYVLKVWDARRQRPRGSAVAADMPVQE